MRQNEKRKPHYSLEEIQVRVLGEGADVFNRIAIENAKDMGLTIEQAINVVCSMTQKDFLQEHDYPCFT